MADGSLTVKLDAATKALLESAAREAGMSPGDYAQTVLARALSAADVTEDLRRLADYDLTGESISVDEAFAHLRQKMAERRAVRA